MWGWQMAWDKFDELFASLARPYSMYICSSSVAFAAVWSVVAAHETAIITIPAAATLAGGQAYLRSLDKQTVAKSVPPIPDAKG